MEHRIKGIGRRGTRHFTDGWNYLNVKIKNGSIPALFLNDIEFELIDSTGLKPTKIVQRAVSINSGDQVFIGDETNKWYNKSIAFDEVLITRDDLSVLKACEQRCPAGADLCMRMCAAEFIKASDFVFLNAAFEDNLFITERNFSEGNAEYTGTFSHKFVRQSAPKTSSYNNQIYIPIELYLITDHKQTASNFSIQYAGWMRKKTIEELGVDTNGNPLISPTHKKYFLTKLYTTMRQEDMTEDIFPRQALDDKLVNARELPLIDSKGAVVLFIVISVIVSTTLLGVLLWWSFGKKTHAEPSSLEERRDFYDKHKRIVYNRNIFSHSTRAFHCRGFAYNTRHQMAF